MSLVQGLASLTLNESEKVRLEAALTNFGLSSLDRVESVCDAGNSRILRVEQGASRWAVKLYPPPSSLDPRNRLRTESKFLAFAANRAPELIPDLVFEDPEHHVAILQWLDGRPVRGSDIDASLIGQAAAFLRCLQQDVESEGNLDMAADAGNDLEAHLSGIERRLHRLARTADVEVRDFCLRELTPLWRRIRESIHGRLDDSCLAGDGWARCASPSDFGFHNALIGPDGVLRFLDFEYGGIDDPVKLTLDFLWRPDPALASSHRRTAEASLVAALDMTSSQCARVSLLEPVHRLKWCCIILNDFDTITRPWRVPVLQREDVVRVRQHQLLRARARVTELREFLV